MQNRLDSKQQPCLLCQSDQFESLGEKNSFRVVRCSKCELVFINPQPSEETTNALYDESYFAGGSEYGYQGIGYLSNNNEQWFKYIPTKAIAKIQKIKPQKGKLLDVGCAVGYALEVAKDKGWEISGVEISQYARKLAEKKLGISIPETLESANYQNDYFDVIAAFEIIEHIHRPQEFIESLHKILKKDGVLCISTPNLDHAKTFKNFIDWPYLTPPEHLCFFNRQTIQNLLEKNGFEIKEIFFGPINPLAQGGENIKRIQKMYHKVRPIVRPIKKLLYDMPMAWYGTKSGLGEDMIIIAQKK
jgi:2-polyprenyl-3-methyl-5-hydroxy-6-metoxy-1,4-benzoquinol methylase